MCKGKAGLELRQERRHWDSQAPAACSFLERQPKSKASLGKASPRQSSLAPGTLPDQGSEQSSSSALLVALLAQCKQSFPLVGSAASSSPEEARFPAGCALAYQAGAQGSSSRSCLRGCFP